MLRRSGTQGPCAALPRDFLLSVFSNPALNVRDLLACASVCRAWAAAASEPSLWQCLVLHDSDFPWFAKLTTRRLVSLLRRAGPGGPTTLCLGSLCDYFKVDLRAALAQCPCPNLLRVQHGMGLECGAPVLTPSDHAVGLFASGATTSAVTTTTRLLRRLRKVQGKSAADVRAACLELQVCFSCEYCLFGIMAGPPGMFRDSPVGPLLLELRDLAQRFASGDEGQPGQHSAVMTSILWAAMHVVGDFYESGLSLEEDLVPIVEIATAALTCLQARRDADLLAATVGCWAACVDTHYFRPPSMFTVPRPTEQRVQLLMSHAAKYIAALPHLLGGSICDTSPKHVPLTFQACNFIGRVFTSAMMSHRSAKRIMDEACPDWVAGAHLLPVWLCDRLKSRLESATPQRRQAAQHKVSYEDQLDLIGVRNMLDVLSVLVAQPAVVPMRVPASSVHILVQAAALHVADGSVAQCSVYVFLRAVVRWQDCRRAAIDAGLEAMVRKALKLKYNKRHTPGSYTYDTMPSASLWHQRLRSERLLRWIDKADEPDAVGNTDITTSDDDDDDDDEDDVIHFGPRIIGGMMMVV